MKRSLLYILTGVLCFSSHCLAAEKSNLWILSGQSNACGRAILPGPKPDERVLMYDPTTKKFIVAQDPLPGMGTTGVGPWVATAQTVAAGGVKIDMLGFASGGKPIQYWNPGSPGDIGLFPRIAATGQGAGVFLWYQGESNSGKPAEVATYKNDLKKLVARVRKAADNPDMTVVVVQLGAFTRDKTRDFMGMREKQRQFVIEDGNAILVPAMGRTLKDAVHLDNAGYRELGREIGRALLKTKYKKESSWPGPVMDQAVLAGDDPRAVNVHFAEAKAVNHCATIDFAVTDKKGTVACKGVTVEGTVAKLVFERPINLPAKIVYGYGENPKALLVDEDGNRAPAVQLPITIGKPPVNEPTKAPNGAGGAK